MPTERVLIVEDDGATQMLLQAILHHHAIECTIVADGAAALRAMRHEEFGAIVLDLLMPVMSGFDVLRELAVSDPQSLDRVIVSTAAADTILTGCSELSKVRCVIRKPLDIDVFVAEIHDSMLAKS